MFNRSCVALVLTAAFSFAPAQAGVILITQAKAVNGGVTPGDAPGFPVTLSLPGAYRFDTNLTPGSNLIGIAVNAADVSIDLNGFTLSGGPVGGANNASHGIVARGDRLTVKNGTIGAFKNAGIWAVDRDYLIVENMRIINSNYGILAYPGGEYARIQNSTIVDNRNIGINCNISCHVEGNIVSHNREAGIRISSGTVLGNTILYNTSYGINNGSAAVGFGNNTIGDNNGGGGAQINGVLVPLHPNYCFPVSC